ncbi:MAG: peptidylprolyl isomerase [Eubacterium sp.]|nr:peptidylprolyl isomerase [Eubacterium sp.]
MANNNAASDKEKVVTKYDRKMQKRKEAERKEAKRRFITKWVCIAVLAGIILGSGTAIGLKLNSIYNDYIEVDNDKISQIKFDFYYGIAKTNNLNSTLYGTMTYGDYYTSYMGYKTSTSDKSQEYSTDYTWYDYFANSAVSTIKETKALLEDADANGFEYDNEDADYDEFIGKLKDAATEADMSYSDYLKQLFGKKANEKRVKTFLKDYLKSTAYQDVLTEKLAATDEEVDEYYQSNKDTYDLFSYRIYTMTADSSDTADMANAKTEADKFASGVTSEATFVTQCRLYSNDEEDKYADADASLVSEVKKSDIESACADWIVSSDRSEGDVTVIEDSANSCYYIVYYINRTYDGADDDTIKSTVLNKKYSEYIKKYTDEYSVNVKKRFSYK